MYTTLKCVALRTVRYDDRRSILSAWSDIMGRISVMVPSGDGREARRRRALTMPLGLFECECDVKPGREILSVRDVRPLLVATSVAANPAKGAVAMFLADVLDHTLRPSQPDRGLTRFIFSAVAVLEDTKGALGVANFHLWFLFNLGLHLGIAPDIGEWRPGSSFDMAEGVFRRSMPLGSGLGPAEARMVRQLGRLTPRNMGRWHIAASARSEMLDQILRYYTLHYVNLDNLRTLAVLRRSV